MSIERNGNVYIPVCDYCGDELPEEWNFYGAVIAVKQANWRSVKDNDDWSHYCPECYSEINSAAADFAEVDK